MRNRAAVIAGLLLGLAAAPPALAADPRGQFAVKGLGQARCSTFNQALAARSPDLPQMLSWVAGYLTAANRYEPATYDLIAWQEEVYVVGAISAYCRQNPEAELAQMVRAMIKSLGPGRLTAASPIQNVVVGGRTVQIYGEVVRRAKERLRARGLWSGSIDMAADGRFIAAVTAFQRAEKLSPTGIPDQETLYRLFAR